MGMSPVKIIFTPLIGFFLFLWARILLSLSSNSCFILWISLEINILGFLPLISFNGNKMLENTIKYFLIQGVSSSMFLLFSILRILLNRKMFDLIIIISLIVKLGSAPFHMWFVSLLRVVSLNTLFLLSTIQKLIPLIILSALNFSTVFMYIFIVLNSFTIFYSGGLSKTLNTVLAFSRINNLRWILLSGSGNLSITIFYFTIYLFLITGVLILFWRPRNTVPSQIVISRLGYGVIGLFTIFSLAGLPPLIGFLGKLFIIKQIFDPSITMIFVILVFRSLFILLFYMRFSYAGVTIVPYNKSSLRTKSNSYSMSIYTRILLRFNVFRLLVPYVS